MDVFLVSFCSERHSCAQGKDSAGVVNCHVCSCQESTARKEIAKQICNATLLISASVDCHLKLHRAATS